MKSSVEKDANRFRVLDRYSEHWTKVDVACYNIDYDSLSYGSLEDVADELIVRVCLCDEHTEGTEE